MMNYVSDSNLRAGLFLGALFGGLAWGWGNVVAYGLTLVVLYLLWIWSEFVDNTERVNVR